MGDRTVLVLTAHADDCEFFAGGTVARFASEGWEVIEVIATDNSRGSYELDSRTLIVQSRDREARAAARILGKKDVVFLNYPDGFLADTPLNELRAKFIGHIRLFRPRLLMTWDPWAPLEPHPDHRHVGLAAVEAAQFASMPLFHPEQLREGLRPHLVAESYYFAKCPERANRVVDVTPFIGKKIEALLAHDSQMKLTVDSARLAFATCGSTPEAAAMLDRENCGPVLDFFVREMARKAGAKAGYEYGEEFRYETAVDLYRTESDSGR